MTRANEMWRQRPCVVLLEAVEGGATRSEKVESAERAEKERARASATG